MNIYANTLWLTHWCRSCTERRNIRWLCCCNHILFQLHSFTPHSVAPYSVQCECPLTTVTLMQVC